MKIYIMKDRGGMSEVFVSRYDTIRQVKDKARLGYVDLRYQGEMLNDLNYICDYNIEEGSYLFSVQKCGSLKGAGMLGLETVDVSKNILKNIGFSDTNKAYKIVNYGLSIQSTCKNKSCIAYNDTIYIQIGFVWNWNVLYNLERVVCPSCYKRAMPSNFGFYNCRYEIEFEKNEGGDFKSGKVTGTSGENEYKIFDQYSSGNASFNKLIFNITSN